ncbi:MAG: type II toxin-antitoxin system VapC family toxin [Rhizomicrobium sp.]|jgi:predicted nucleic acid-binding protein
MNLYAESSAVLSWVLGEPGGPVAFRHLQDAEKVVSSDLTLVECDRNLHRAVSTGSLEEARAAHARALLASAVRLWNVLELNAPIIARAREPFPNEPIRSLDALHVASALHARAFLPDLAILSLDERIRRVATSLGFQLLPA